MLKKILGLCLLILGLLFCVLITPDKTIEELTTKYSNEVSQFVEIEGMNVHYRIEGNGFPLLLLHGTGSSLHTWDEWMELLMDSFQIVRLDLPAYGLTGPFINGDYSHGHYLSFLDEFVKEVGIDSFHIAGNSFGGGLAFSYAGEHSDKVAKIILIDPAGIDNDSEPPAVFTLAQNPFLSQIMKAVTPKSFIRKNLEEVYADDSKISDDLITRYHDFAIRKGNRQAFIDRVNQPRESIQHYLSSLEEPTLIQWGEEDKWTPFKNAEIMHDLIPNSKLISYPNVGHLPMEETPDQSAKDAMLFLLEESFQ